VYDVLGKEVATLVNDEQRAGNYKVTFDAGNLPSGTYFYTLKSGVFAQTRKLTVVK
jgi:TctA family transporter